MKVASGPRIVFRADASDRMGAGHVMRCLTLADALAERGATISFVSASITAGLAQRVRQAGYDLHEITALRDAAADRPDWDTHLLSEEAQRSDARQTLEAVGERAADWIVVDHYRLDRSWEEKVREVAGSILVLDDLANREHDCDLLLDHSFGRTSADYIGLTPPHCRVLAGGEHVLLRPEFARQRSAALSRRGEERPVERLLISFGTTDIGGIARKALQAVLDAGVKCGIDVVVGTGTAELAAITDLASAHPDIDLHVDSSDIAGLMAAADLALGAGGMTTWERCCLGLPSIVVILAENQKASVSALAASGAVEALSSIEQMGPAISALAFDPARRRKMAAISQELVDGEGAVRVASIMLGHGSPGSKGEKG